MYFFDAFDCHICGFNTCLWSPAEMRIHMGADALAAVNQKLLIDELTREVALYP